MSVFVNECEKSRTAGDIEIPLLREFYPGRTWLDINGHPIQAHGGGVLYYEGRYYWYGENKSGKTSVVDGVTRIDVVGINCYSSADLYNWKNEGVVLPAVDDDLTHDLHITMVVERPKVIFNDSTGEFVMWMHIDSSDYTAARTGVAVSHSPTGPFTYLGSFRPNEADSRDMTIFKDDDGAAYLVYSSNWNKTTRIVRLSDDYKSATDEHIEVFESQYRESPAVWKCDGIYYMISSFCTGWAPNPAQYAVSDSMMGDWRIMGNPVRGSFDDVQTTFQAQDTFVLPVVGMPGTFIFMADRWNPKDLSDSRYVWLPMQIDGPNVIIRWHDSWALDTEKSY